jgi:hypothetical protein
MRRRLFAVLAVITPTLAIGVPALSQPAGMTLLSPHRAVYDLSLARSTGPRGIESARGRIALDFGGDACEGYTMKYRQVTVLGTNESGSRTLDVRTATFEAPDGRSMRFRTDSQMEGVRSDNVDGDASVQADGALSVQLRQPRRETLTIRGEPIFPTEHLKRVIAAARAGQPSLSVKVFDGSDDGRKVYDTLAMIGRRIEPGGRAELEAPARQEPLASLPRWPITISYFTAGSGDQTPAYVISFELYENGISRALRIDYGDFALRGDLQQLELLPATTCQR